ncbi:DNA polymerase III [Treponema sp.]|uniref:DNA polymerase III n=1 Tax=Treponema sp. TaxID=166 RepID=UPI003EFD1C3B
MFENILNQSATSLLREDIEKKRLPGSILFSGPVSSGKLSAALETARILSCANSGEWNCNCSSCRQNKALVSPSLLVLGAGNRTLEIAAAKKSLLSQNVQNTKHLEASRYFFIRAVRKLTVRFSPVLWEGDDKLQKFSPLVQEIEEELEQIEPGRILPEDEELSKITEKIEKACAKLEGCFLYGSVPVLQIRNLSSWAHLASSSGKKVLIIENADLMADSARNALLKILEEPPRDVVFILTTSRRGAMLPTILSRVRTYVFFERTAQQQKNVIDRIFHYEPQFNGGKEFDSINVFLQSFLSVKPELVKSCAADFFSCIAQGHVPDIQKIMSQCSSFEPRVLFRIFILGLIEAQEKLKLSAAGSEISFEILGLLKSSLSNAETFNQNPAACLEELARSIMHVNYMNNGILRELILPGPQEKK